MTEQKLKTTDKIIKEIADRILKENYWDRLKRIGKTAR